MFVGEILCNPTSMVNAIIVTSMDTRLMNARLDQSLNIIVSHVTSMVTNI
jgi:hypothetical protein